MSRSGKDLLHGMHIISRKSAGRRGNDTPMKYSALEVLSTNIPTVSMRYEDAIKKYIEFPKMEWICKMGLNKIAKGIINSRYSGYQTGKGQC